MTRSWNDDDSVRYSFVIQFTHLGFIVFELFTSGISLIIYLVFHQISAFTRATNAPMCGAGRVIEIFSIACMVLEKL